MSRQRDAHESYAVAAGSLHWSAAILAGSLLLVVLGMYELAQHWLHLEPDQPVATLPPQPRLQPDPASDIATERMQQRARLDRYEWIDRDAGIARIPVTRAMQLLATQPASSSPGVNPPQEQQPPPAPASTGELAPNSGAEKPATKAGRAHLSARTEAPR